MSKDKLDLVRGLQEAWNRGDPITLTDYFHPDVVFIPLRAATEGAYRGIAGMERFVADTLTVFDRFEMRNEFAEFGERVVSWGVVRIRTRESGIETEVESSGVFEFRDGKIVRWEDFGSKERALAAVADC
jgi:ketosteroid isomerase-like protein